MAKHSTLTALFSAIANSLRAKTGTSGTIIADDFPSVIDGISVGSGTTPTGTIKITANGTHDVTNYASADVNVPTPEQITEVRTVTFSSDIVGSAQQTTIFSADEFVKKHYSNNVFAIAMYPLTTFDSVANDFLFIYHTNKNIGANGVTRTGVVLKATSASATTISYCTARIDGKGYNMHFRADSTGKLTIYTAANYNIKAGQYVLVMTCTD